MGVFTHSDDLTPAPAELFAVFLRPALAVALAPAAFPLELLDGPEVLVPGATLALRTRRYGLAWKLIHRVEIVEPAARLVHVQVRGPFRAYRLTQVFAPLEGGCRLTEEAIFEPPGGVLGQLLTEARIRADLDQLYQFRRAVFQARGWLSGP